MKLLYPTSIRYPSSMANRLQILDTAKHLYAADPEIRLGIYELSGSEPFPIITFPGSRKSIWLGLRYARYIQKEGVTHVYCREDYLLFFMIVWAKLLGAKTKFFFEAHKLHEGWAFPFVIRMVDGIVSITRALKEDIVALGISAQKIAVVPDAVELERFKLLGSKEELRKELGLPLEKKIIAYPGGFGKFHSWKGADVLVESAAGTGDDWLYVLVGGLPEELEAFAEKYQYKNVRMEQPWTPDRVAKLLVAADAGVIPNKKGYVMSERHTSPMKLFEYMAARVPILASDLMSIREIVSEEEVLFFEPNNPEALRKGLEEIFAHPEEAKRRVDKAWEAVQEHTYELRAKHILAFLAEGKV